MLRDSNGAGAAVLVTVPVGVLKKGTIAFEPPLPTRKRDVIERMGFGLLNKVGRSELELSAFKPMNLSE